MTWDATQHRFKPATQRFTLKYFDRGVLKQQNVQRVARRPDIIFDAQPLEPVPTTSGTQRYYFSKMAEATTAARWVNLGYLNGNSNAAGPGIITPAAMTTLTFDSSSGLPNPFTRQRWGSFDESSNEPILFPPIYAEP